MNERARRIRSQDLGRVDAEPAAHLAEPVGVEMVRPLEERDPTAAERVPGVEELEDRVEGGAGARPERELARGKAAREPGKERGRRRQPYRAAGAMEAGREAEPGGEARRPDPGLLRRRERGREGLLSEEGVGDREDIEHRTTGTVRRPRRL